MTITSVAIVRPGPGLPIIVKQSPFAMPYEMPYAVDVGTVNSVVVAFTPPITTPRAGSTIVQVKAANANTGASTITVDGTTYPLVRDDGTVLQQNDMAVGIIYQMQFDGASWRMAYRAAAAWSTGDGKITLRTTPDQGWILADDGTFGSANSGSSNRAHIDTHDLFNLFWSFADADAPLKTSTGDATTRSAQTDAATAWNNNCRMTLTRQLGRGIAIAGAGSGLTARTLGHFDGAETHTQSENELVQHSHVPANGAYILSNYSAASYGYTGPPGGGQVSTDYLNTTGASWAMSIMNPRSYWNAHIKL